eukprot:CAMPEP_0179034378 /NCGR_PEP_ID=MMETSP0796-20121207/12579_1 /TAXON_ID=73915 /ORGANISM="Pyrodinium bahamense, Strain pbaha01" /LENGTH=43 /DNA_ID= /DNA_START= /DNA_END= /DNA_ORIENTATION=
MATGLYAFVIVPAPLAQGADCFGERARGLPVLDDHADVDAFLV